MSKRTDVPPDQGHVSPTGPRCIKVPTNLTQRNHLISVTNAYYQSRQISETEMAMTARLVTALRRRMGLRIST